LSLAIVISMFISLTTTPMLCALFLRRRAVPPLDQRPSLFERAQNF